MDLLEQDVLGDSIGAHWYYRSKRHAVLSLLGDRAPRSVLDVGAGSGFFAREILRATRAERAVCVDPNYPADRDEQEAGKPILFRREIDGTDADLLLLMDVLEHVDDDAGLLGQYLRLARPGSTVLISVPAFQWLWSGHDVFLGHRRRYTVRQIEAVARDCGLDIHRSCYFFASVFPIAALRRLPAAIGQAWSGQSPEARSDMRHHGPVVNTVLSGLCRAELPVFRHNRVFGLTAFVLGQVR
ncbi:class I SAM-dependent methyltransferase [Roseomonas eburnea]|uniref:Class I SAM-dependent methyltransferase n=1 Tax=Neoroseomonas eburnea TaxID=1346889 RepID=A0A9X9XCI5_9PROT|nr:methyltransferase domain-containing protein [Neoroseomonas eburnea]MBR0681421.1 class I SAM-dependent methyltransferase [Neoroseomonas eburnea]